jgi:hypothetical protein
VDEVGFNGGSGDLSGIIARMNQVRISVLRSMAVIAALLLLGTAATARAAGERRPHLALDLSDAWRFQPDSKGDGLSRGVTGLDFDDSSWVVLNALQQWQLQPKSPVADYHGVGWYRKEFDAPEIKRPQRAIVYFGGADGNTVIYLNGKKMGAHETAGAKENYAGWNAPFYFDVTDDLRPGRNVLAVEVTSKPALASGLHGGVSLWAADSPAEMFRSLLPNPFWAIWTTRGEGPMPAGWRIYSKPELRKQLKTDRVHLSDGSEGLSITLPGGNCNLFPAAPALEKPGVYHFGVRLSAQRATSVRARMYLPRPGEVVYQAKEFYGQTVKLTPNEPQELRFDIPTSESGRVCMLYIYLHQPEGLVISNPMLVWEKGK